MLPIARREWIVRGRYRVAIANAAVATVDDDFAAATPSDDLLRSPLRLALRRVTGTGAIRARLSNVPSATLVGNHMPSI